MHVQDITLQNMLLKADKGIDVQEASGITFKNIRVIPSKTNPVVDIIQSDNLLFENFAYPENPEMVFRISGERAKNIRIKNAGGPALTGKIKEELGAVQSVSVIK